MAGTPVPDDGSPSLSRRRSPLSGLLPARLLGNDEVVDGRVEFTVAQVLPDCEELMDEFRSLDSVSWPSDTDLSVLEYRLGGRLYEAYRGRWSYH